METLTRRATPLALLTALLAAVALAAWMGPALIDGALIDAAPDAPGPDAVLWIGLLVVAALALLSVQRLAQADDGPGWRGALLRHATPALFGVWIVYFWQVLVRAFAVPRVLLPAPSDIGLALLAQSDVLAGDFVQTVVRAVLAGYVLGCGLGFMVGVLIDRSPFLQRGLLPVAAMASTVPLVGVAPIMVMWFGFDWPSKSAVVVIMTFFPMLVNTLAGLQSSGHMERDLMRSYAAGYWRTLGLLRLPAAMPFVFNALKINATLALIGAIVAEFFGSPTAGMGFRISTEAARMNMGLVWATILVAAVSGSGFYALLSWVERLVTFWHPSLRQRRDGGR